MFENGVDVEGEKGESVSSHQFTQNEVNAPVTPAKTGQPDPNIICKNWLENPFDEAIFEATSVKKSFSCLKDGNLGSTSQTWNKFSFTDLLAMADAGKKRGSDDVQTQESGRLNLLYDLNSPPQMMSETLVNTGLSLQFTPLTPDQAKRMNLAADKDVVETNQESEKGLAEQANLDESPQLKQKRRKHRPKVVTEGKPKRVRVRKSATPKPDGSSTGKRKYVRRNVVERSPTTPAVDETGETVHPKPDGSSTGKRKYVRRKVVEKTPTTPAVDERGEIIHLSPDQEKKKTCKRKIDFDECEKRAEAMDDKTSTMASGVGENYQKVHETESVSPITPSKTELPHGISERNYTKAKCKINFSEETHDKVSSHLSSPNEPSCSTGACNRENEAQGLNDGSKLWNEHYAEICRDPLESYLSIFTDYNIGNMRSTAINMNKGKAPEIPKDRYTQTCGQNFKRNKIMVCDSVPLGGRIDGGYQQKHTYMETLAADFQVSMKKTKKSVAVTSLYHNHLGYYNSNLRWESIYSIDALISQFERLHINRDAVVPGYHEKNAVVIYQQDRSLVPYGGLFSPIKKKKQRPKVDLDDETNRVWMLLLEDINSKGVDGTDEGKQKWWEEERRVFRGRADSFIARMHLVQGDRRFSQWKGSVLDSVVGVFLTQNVSDHLSSSAFMSLAARYPLKQNTDSEPLHEEPIQVDLSEAHDPIPMMLQEVNLCEEKEVVNSNEVSKSCVISVDLIDKSEFEVAESFEKDSVIYKESVITHVQIDEISSSQNSTDTCSMQKSEEQKDGCKASVGEYTSLVELMHMQGTTQVNERESIHKSIEKCISEESAISVESASQMTVQMVNTISSQESTNSNCCMVQQVLEKTNISTETSSASKNKNIVEVSEESVQKEKTNVMDEGSSKGNKEKTEKMQMKDDWDKLRFYAEVKQKRERSPNTMDSMDYEAIRTANVDEVADAIKERGMNNRLAARIKDMLDRLVRDHGSTDLEWLRDVPPDKAKEYLLSFKGLGLKSVECIRLLTLHHLAFPVDTNVGRIAVRLGWVPLQALPESLQLHLLELYPVQETIQKYLWPRLCKLDQKTLYELHYQMITFGKVFCTKTKPNCNACPLRGECRHFASAFASARLALPAPDESMPGPTENRAGQNTIGMIDLPSISEQPKQLPEVQNGNIVVEDVATPGPIVEVLATPGPMVEVPATPGSIVEIPATPRPIVEMPASPEPEQIQHEVFDIEDFNGDDEEIPMIKLNIEEFTQNLQTYMETHMELAEGDMSKALVALTPEAASIPTPKLKNVNQLRTEHQVYELPDSHPLLEGLDKRETDDPCPYLLAIWTPGETADSIQPPEGQCCSQESGTLCNQETCFFCISTREANAQTIRGTLLIPCRTAMRGSFPLNGTYFQVNEVFADHDSSLNPINVPRDWLWNLPKRTVYFGTSIPTIFKGLTTEEIQYCFWRGFVCVRGFDRKERAPRPLKARLHFPASRLKQSKPKTDQKRS